jgi:hypothetical protein
MRETGVDEPAPQRTVAHVTDRHTVEECGRETGTACGEPQHPPRRTTVEHPAGLTAVHTTVGLQPEADRKRRSRRPRHTESPPSTVITAPVIAALSVPAIHTSAAAISSGSSSRPTGCWSTNPAVSASS